MLSKCSSPKNLPLCDATNNLKEEKDKEPIEKKNEANEVKYQNTENRKEEHAK